MCHRMLNSTHTCTYMYKYCIPTTYRKSLRLPLSILLLEDSTFHSMYIHCACALHVHYMCMYIFTCIYIMCITCTCIYTHVFKLCVHTCFNERCTCIYSFIPQYLHEEEQPTRHSTNTLHIQFVHTYVHLIV